MPFEFTGSFTDEALNASFQRKFAHDDWIDGVSTIQAERNGAEKGFNIRFHQIESDLDALGRDGQASLAALTTSRQQLRTLLDEIRGELSSLSDPHRPATQALAAAPGWTKQGADVNDPQCLVDGFRIVHLRGVLTSSSAPLAPGLLVATLPTAARPNRRCVFAAASALGTSRVDVLPDGRIQVLGGYGGWLSLDGLHYLAA